MSYDLLGDNKGNQAQLLLFFIKGRDVWSQESIKYAFDKGPITVTIRESAIVFGTANRSPRETN